MPAIIIVYFAKKLTRHKRAVSSKSKMMSRQWSPTGMPEGHGWRQYTELSGICKFLTERGSGVRMNGFDGGMNAVFVVTMQHHTNEQYEQCRSHTESDRYGEVVASKPENGID